MKHPVKHFALTNKLAKKLKKKDIYDWFMTKGFFPESYVLPPCFTVTDRPQFGKVYFPKLKLKPAEPVKVAFPKTNLTDRTFSIINPEIHSDVAFLIAKNWAQICKTLFHPQNKICSYSFPIPLNANAPGEIGKLRSGRMIYEWIEMAENDMASIAFNYKLLLKTDIKNFYPSIYTHSIAWALHGKHFIRKGKNRTDYKYLGNKFDKLFQRANDDCTNGIPIGPAVSDLIAEIILAGVDRIVSQRIAKSDPKIEAVIVRFKDDYRILCNTESEGKRIIKILQSGLKEYNLELHDEKTQQYSLPGGLFRDWKSLYHAANPYPKKFYSYKRFQETYLSVIEIDKQCPGTGVIDRFLVDIVNKNGALKMHLNKRSLPKVVSLLFMMARKRIKTFPKVLAIIEAVLKTPFGENHVEEIVNHLEVLLSELSKDENDNRYLIMWIVYFLRANNLENFLTGKYNFKNPVLRSISTSRNAIFKECKDFKLFTGVKTVARQISMYEHINVFQP